MNIGYTLENLTPEAVASAEEIACEGEVRLVRFSVRFPTPTVPQDLKLKFEIPAVDLYTTWLPIGGGQRKLRPNWSPNECHSRLESGTPLQAFVSLAGKNRLTVAVSDAATPLTIRSGVSEDSCNMCCEIRFFTMPVAPLTEYSATVRLDLRDIPYEDALRDGEQWWRTDLAYTCADTPDTALRPMYSTWYSYHQELHPEALLTQCRLAKALGMECIIVDDGWQTGDSNRGYAYCGDWEPTDQKLGNMRVFSDAVHQTGMKIMLWYAVSLIGVHSKNFEAFKTMLLGYNRPTYAVLDPRYPKVRRFLCDLYEKALTEWDLDGFKLDFIDAFRLFPDTPVFDERRDTQILEEGVDLLLKEIAAHLRAIKPDVLLEFRQTYIGPVIRRYGNMLRVADCPNDTFANRVESINLRMLAHTTAVHTDMMMWHPDEPAHAAARQLLHAFFCVPQISVRLEEQSKEQIDMLRFYLAFWNRHRDLLCHAPLYAPHPEAGYSMAYAQQNGTTVAISYMDTVMRLPAHQKKTCLINAGGRDTVVLLLEGCIGATCTVYNCTGEVVDTFPLTQTMLNLAIPDSGIAMIE